MPVPRSSLSVSALAAYWDSVVMLCKLVDRVLARMGHFKRIVVVQTWRTYALVIRCLHHSGAVTAVLTYR